MRRSHMPGHLRRSVVTLGRRYLTQKSETVSGSTSNIALEPLKRPARDFIEEPASRSGGSSMRDRLGKPRVWWALVVVLVWLPSRHAHAQTASGTLTLNDAVQAALKNYPAIRERRARAQ